MVRPESSNILPGFTGSVLNSMFLTLAPMVHWNLLSWRTSPSWSMKSCHVPMQPHAFFLDLVRRRKWLRYWSLSSKKRVSRRPSWRQVKTHAWITGILGDFCRGVGTPLLESTLWLAIYTTGANYTYLKFLPLEPRGLSQNQIFFVRRVAQSVDLHGVHLIMPRA